MIPSACGEWNWLRIEHIDNLCVTSVDGSWSTKTQFVDCHAFRYILLTWMDSNLLSLERE